MRRFTERFFVAFVGLMFATTGLVRAATNDAPADEYFGHYHLSILGIRNAITDMTQRAIAYPDRAASYLPSAELAEDAIHQWQNRYPQDSWLPKSILALEQLYVTIHTAESLQHAVQSAAWLDTSFPQSDYAAMGHAELANTTTSDDGTPTSSESPHILGVLPGLVQTASAGNTSDETDSSTSTTETPTPPAQPEIPSYAERDDRSVDITVQQP